MRSMLTLLFLVAVHGSHALAQVARAPLAPSAAPAQSMQAATSPSSGVVAPLVSLPSQSAGGAAPAGPPIRFRGADDCVTPDAISGVGSFVIDTTLATGSLNAPCGPIHRDVWLHWTAPSSGGSYRVSTCGGTAADTSIAVWHPGQCPPTALVACADNSCGLQSRVQFSAAPNEVFLLQVGCANPATTFVGSLAIAALAPPANDTCASPANLAGGGPFAFDCASATTGFEGQTNAVCAYGTSAIEHDVWFTWTAGASGLMRLSTCGSFSVDTKIAIYGGGGCPSSSAIVCGENECASQTTVVWGALAGATYSIQLGTSFGTPSGSGSFQIVPHVAPANDDCATPAALGGPGPYAFDNSNATTGDGGADVWRDVWYSWTAPSSGWYRVFTCGSTNVDTALAVFAGGACPSGAPLAFDDNGCGFRSDAAWLAAAGSTSVFQLGSSPFHVGGSGAFGVQQIQFPAGDVCSSPATIAGTGAFAFDNSFATTGIQGQSEPACADTTLGLLGIEFDLWFDWTAPSTDWFRVGTVGTTAVDTKLAVYAGGSCPTAAALVCNDDACSGSQSRVSFHAVAGQRFSIQVGSFPFSGVRGPGALLIEVAPIAAASCAYDDGAADTAFGLPPGGRVAWLQPFGAPGRQTFVERVSAMFGPPLAPSAPAIGAPVDILLWEDPNDDGDPHDAVLVHQGAGVVSHVSDGVFDDFAVPGRWMDGVFFAGVALDQLPNQFPAPFDTSVCEVPAAVAAWFVGDAGGVLDVVNLNNNGAPPANVSTSIINGQWMLRAGCSVPASVSLCHNGDPNRISCPCGNQGSDPFAGCASSANPAGSRLLTTGAPAANDVVLHSSGMSGNVCVFFRTLGPAVAAGVAFGDGVTCTGGSLLRLRSVPFPPGLASVASFPDATETVSLSTRSGTAPGSGAVMQYGALYRNSAAGFCPPATFNTGNTLQLTW